MKACNQCNTLKEFSDFYKSRSICKKCYKINVAENKRLNPNINRKYRQKNIENIRENDKLRSKEARAHRPDVIKASRDRWKINNPELELYSKKKWRSNNKPKIKELAAKRRAAKKMATPPWLTEDHWRQIEEIYENCPPGYHVDHIMPLNGRNLCGLHVPWNLQYLPAEANLKKSNKVV